MTSTPSATSGGTGHVLPRERAGASFDVRALRRVVTRGKGAARLREFEPLFDANPLFDRADDHTLSYAASFEKSIDRVAEAFRVVRDNPKFMVAHMRQDVQMEDFFEHNGVFLHFTMMLNYLKSQGNPAQQRYWLGRARGGDFIAAYAQTELGHGSNVRGIETTATLDVARQEWEIHSPTLTSLKWWPTGMYACTHALVFANLIIGDTNNGFHGFLVQLRGPDGTTMPGVELGEIGPKLNYSSTNIGYCRFTRVRVPMDRLFSKHSTVTAAGEYIKPPRSLSKFRYISMMLARTSIVRIAYKMCAKATTIAVRYSAVRLQGFKAGTRTTTATSDRAADHRPEAREHYVLDYQMQQYRCFKALALSYCLLWSSRFIQGYIKRVAGAITEGDDAAAAELPQLHATLSGLKAVSTVRAHEAIEDCRKCCGGQGFLLSSGIAKLAPDFSEWVTVEGEQVILLLQCARSLIKAVHARSNDLPKAVAYLGVADDTGPVDVSTTAGILAALQVRARGLARRFVRRFDAQMAATGGNFDAALNACSVLACRAATAHVEQFMLSNNMQALPTYFDAAPATCAVMERLLALLGLQLLSENSGDLAGAGWTSAAADAVDARIPELLAAIRPDAVPLVDAFGFLDTQLKSTIGREDGNVYEAIYAEAQRNPLNRVAGGKMVGWDNYVTVLDPEFLEETARAQYQAKAAATAVGDPGTMSRL